MGNRRKYDVFLSYRRDGGDMTALYLYERLTHAGYRVAYDFETLLNGRWDDKILETVKSCKDLIVVLSPGALDRCIEWEKANPNSIGFDKNDWMRREVACALENKRNVVPVLLRDFAFPLEENLPKDVRALPFQNGIGASVEHRRDTLSRIRKMLISKPAWYHHPTAWIAGLVATVLVSISLGIWGIPYFKSEKPYPSTQEEIQELNEVVSVIARQAGAYQEAAQARSNLVSKAYRAVQLSKPSVLETELPAFRRTMADAIDKLAKARPPASAFDSLRKSPIPIDVYASLFDSSAQELRDDLQSFPAILSFYAGTDNPLPLEDRLDCIDRKAKLVGLRAQWYALGIFELFQGVEPSALSEFKNLTPSFTAIPRLSQPWPADKEQLAIEQKTVDENLQKALIETVAQTGKLNLETAADRTALENLLVQSGISSNQASELTGKISVLAAKQTDLAATEGMLAAKKDTLYAKFKPLPSDDSGILWSKALRFHSVHMEDAALEALAFLAERDSPDFRPGAVRAMEAICKLGESVPFDSGVMVSAYEPPAVSHAVFQPGDVIVARDGSFIRHVDVWKTAPGSTYRFWRLDDDGVFQPRESILPPDQPRVGLVEIAETED